MIAKLVSEYGKDTKAKLAGGIGEDEAKIRKPLEVLLVAAAKDLKHGKVVFYDEVSLFNLGVRPDFAFSVDGAITGYVEVKKPGTDLDPSSFRGHNKKQWERQRDLPNLLYTNGSEFRLYRDGELAMDPVVFSGGSLEFAGSKLAADSDFRVLLSLLFDWKPAPIVSVGRLVKAVAPLTRLLREAVVEQLEHEAQPGETDKPFTGLARDWRNLLFPEATDEAFADGYAQTVTFALLLAKSEGIKLEADNLHRVGQDLGHRHSLMGRALQVLTDNLAGQFTVTLGLLVRVIEAVDWPKIEAGNKDAYAFLYENFLEDYDPELRRQSGSYYTPVEVVDQMVRLSDEALTEFLGIERSFRDDRVLVVDPAMGTGTYLQSIMKRSAQATTEELGEGAAGDELSSVAERSIGFEIQTGPFAVSELRLNRLLSRFGGKAPEDGMRLYVADTLADPYAPVRTLASNLQPISDSRKAAAEIKREANVTVVIGNPPYKERAEGLGGWIEQGSGSDAKKGGEVPLDQFRLKKDGTAQYVLKNLYVYFWRWGTWKVFDSIESDTSGIVCFITTAGYLGGPGFKGMREYLRRRCSHGWIIDVSPEGMRPEVNTRVFPGVQQPLAIGLFVRGADTQDDEPARVLHRTIHGLQREKYEQLAAITLTDDGWREARDKWQAPFTPAAKTGWDEFPALGEMMPWVAPGVKPNRTWVYAPEPQVLVSRWRALVAEDDPDRKQEMFKESDAAKLDKVKQPLPGFSYQPNGSFRDERGPCPEPVQVGYRAFDRQYIIPDSRLLHRPSPPLWFARIPGQVFCVEQHAHAFESGPGLIFVSLIPDMHHFNNRGGRALPRLHPDGTPNLAPGLLDALKEHYPVTPHDLLAYLAGVTSHPAFVGTFVDELTTPGIRVPITADSEIFSRAVELGRRVIWLHTFGESQDFAPEGEDLEFPKGDPRRPSILTAMKGMAEEPETYDPEANELHFGTAHFGPVSPEVAAYDVGGRNVIHSWCAYRKENPAGRRSSPLDDINATSWSNEWTRELLEVITVLQKLVDQEEAQAEVLKSILAGPLISRDELAASGVSWPASKADRKPRYPDHSAEMSFSL